MPHQDVKPGNIRPGRVMRQRLTPAELRLWTALRNRGLGGLRFRRQAPLGAYILDFFCPETRLAVEIDGGQHVRHDNARSDADRDEWLKTNGVRVVRFTNHQVLSNVELVCDAILVAATPGRAGPA